MKSPESESLPPLKRFAESKDRGVNDYVNDALQVLGEETEEKKGFRYGEVFPIFNHLNEDQANELLDRLKSKLKEATGKSQKEKMGVKKEWLEWATGQADAYRLGVDKDNNNNSAPEEDELE